MKIAGLEKLNSVTVRGLCSTRATPPWEHRVQVEWPWQVAAPPALSVPGCDPRLMDGMVVRSVGRREATLKQTQDETGTSSLRVQWPRWGHLVARPHHCRSSRGWAAQGFPVRFPSFQKQSARVLSPDHEAAGIQRKLVWLLEQLPLWL